MDSELPAFAKSILSIDLIFEIRKQYHLPWQGIHGVTHWARVLMNGLEVCKLTGADRDVIVLFSLFHDACREDDLSDPEHGQRGATLASDFQGRLFQLESEKMALLTEACRDHTHVKRHSDKTIQSCWDADRLDLSRIGAEVDPDYLGDWATTGHPLIESASDRGRFKVFPFQKHFC